MVRIETPSVALNFDNIVFTNIGTQRFEQETDEGVVFLEVRYGLMPKKKLYQDKEWLHREYVVNGRTMSDIAQQFGLTPMSIQLWLNKLEIPTRSRGRRS